MDEYTLRAVFTECPGDYPKKPMIALSGLHQLTVKRA